MIFLEVMKTFINAKKTKDKICLKTEQKVFAKMIRLNFT